MPESSSPSYAFGDSDTAGGPGDGCSVRIVIATAAIRARFATERPAVRDDEWDERDYMRQREAAYTEAFARFAPGADVCFQSAASVMAAARGICLARCPVSEDAVFIELAGANGVGDESLQAKFLRAARRVFTDASAWRRSLLAPYFARHREWRARVGSPIQH